MLTAGASTYGTCPGRPGGGGFQTNNEQYLAGGLVRELVCEGALPLGQAISAGTVPKA